MRYLHIRVGTLAKRKGEYPRCHVIPTCRCRSIIFRCHIINKLVRGNLRRRIILTQRNINQSRHGLFLVLSLKTIVFQACKAMLQLPHAEMPGHIAPHIPLVHHPTRTQKPGKRGSLQLAHNAQPHLRKQLVSAGPGRDYLRTRKTHELRGAFAEQSLTHPVVVG